MIIVGTSGSSKELLTVYSQFSNCELVFFNDFEDNISQFFSEKFRIIKSIEELKLEFKTNNQFVIGIGNPFKRRKIDMELSEIGGIHKGIISPFSKIGKFGNIISSDVTILTNTIITCNVTIKKGVFINKACIISHDVFIGSYSVISPDVKLMGNVTIGNNCFIGAGAIINPHVVIGDNSIIGSGSVVLNDIPKNSKYVGNPARKIN